MYVHCFVLLHTYMCVQWLIQAEQCTYLSVHGSSGFIQSQTSDLSQVGVNVPVFLCHSSKKEPSESGRAAGRAPAAMPVPCTNCTGFVFRNFSEDTI